MSEKQLILLFPSTVIRSSNNCLTNFWLLCNLSRLTVCKSTGSLELSRKLVTVGSSHVLREVVVAAVITPIAGYEVIEAPVVDIISFKEHPSGQPKKFRL